MGSSENISIVPVQFGGYSADAIIGKVSGFSPDSMNVRYDLFGGIESILGNSAFNTNQTGGAYGLGGDIFQYIRKDGTFDVVLSRQKAESKMYKVGGRVTVSTNTINTTAGFNAGTPTNGDNLLTVGTNTISQKNITFGSATPSAILNPDFESDFTNWTISGPTAPYWIIGSTGAQHGTKYAASWATTGATAVKILDSSDVVLKSYSLGAAGTWTKYTIPASDLLTYYGTSIKISFVIGTSTLVSDAFTYNGDNIAFYYKIAGYLAIDNITLTYGAVVTATIDYGIATGPLGNLTAGCTLNGNSVIFQIATSDDDMTYSAYSTVMTATTVNTTQSIGSQGKRYIKVRAIPVDSGSGAITINNLYIGAQWLSAIQDLTATPTAWGLFNPSFVNPAILMTFEMDTSTVSNFATSDGYVSITPGNLPTNTLRRYIRYRVTMITVDYTLLAQLNSLNLNYTLTTAGASLVQLTGWGGTGYNTYFAVLNNYLIISDGTTAAMSWNGTGTAFSAIATAPSGAYPEVHYDRYFLAYNATYPSRIWYSNIYDPLTWDTANNYIDVNPDDGDSITGIKSYGGVLYVFKKNHAYMIQGNTFNPTTGNYSRQSMQQLPGCESHNSIVVGSDGNMYWYSNQGVVQYNGSYTPNFIGRGFIDKTVERAGFKQKLTDYNQMSSVDFISYNEIWFSFGHTIYTYNYTQQKWGSVLFDNSATGYTVFSLAKYSDTYSNNILSFTGNNVIEQWDDNSTFYIGSIPTPFTLAIESYYQTDFIDGDWYYNKDNYKALLSVRPLTATTIYVSHYFDFSAAALATETITCPTTALPDQYRVYDLASINAKRVQFKIDCLAGQFGISDMAIQTEITDGGRL